MFERAPNGFFTRDLIVFNHLRRGGYVAKGFIFEAPDLTNSPIADLNDFQDQLCLLLASLHENQRLQVQYFCDSDYKGELLRYQQETERFSQRLDEARAQRTLRPLLAGHVRTQTPPAARHLLHLARVGERAQDVSDRRRRRDYYATLLDQLQTEFEHVHRLLLEIFGSGRHPRAADVRSSTIPALQAVPQSVTQRPFRLRSGRRLSPELSIQENCWHSEGNGQSDFGFFLDGHYHSLIVLTRWPRTTYPGIIQRLTNLRLLDYTITVNV
jgi:hypothetical protein